MLNLDATLRIVAPEELFTVDTERCSDCGVMEIIEGAYDAIMEKRADVDPDIISRITIEKFCANHDLNSEEPESQSGRPRAFLEPDVLDVDWIVGTIDLIEELLRDAGLHPYKNPHGGDWSIFDLPLYEEDSDDWVVECHKDGNWYLWNGDVHRGPGFSTAETCLVWAFEHMDKEGYWPNLYFKSSGNTYWLVIPKGKA